MSISSFAPYTGGIAGGYIEQLRQRPQSQGGVEKVASKQPEGQDVAQQKATKASGPDTAGRAELFRSPDIGSLLDILV